MLMSAFVWILVLGFVSNASKSKKRARSDNKNTVGEVYRRGSDRLQVKQHPGCSRHDCRGTCMYFCRMKNGAVFVAARISATGLLHMLTA